MKKLFLTFIFLLISISPVESLPLETKDEVSDWIKNHSFLASYYFLEPGMGDEQYLTGFRQLQDGFFIDVTHLFYDNGNSESGKPVKAEYTELKLTQRKYVEGNKKGYFPENTYFIQDKRPWEVIKTVDIWSRKNQQALSLIEKIFGDSIKNDFENSRMIFSDNEFVEMVPSEYFRTKINYPNVYPIEPRSHVKLFIGEKWGYEIHGFYPSTPSRQRDMNNPETTFIIKAKNEIMKDSQTLIHNKRIFDKKKSIDENRNSVRAGGKVPTLS